MNEVTEGKMHYVHNSWACAILMKDTWDNNIMDLVQYVPKIGKIYKEVFSKVTAQNIHDKRCFKDVSKIQWAGCILTHFEHCRNKMKLKCYEPKHVTPISAKGRSMLRKACKDEKVIFSKHIFGDKSLSAGLLEYNPQHL